MREWGVFFLVAISPWYCLIRPVIFPKDVWRVIDNPRLNHGNYNAFICDGVSNNRKCFRRLVGHLEKYPKPIALYN